MDWGIVRPAAVYGPGDREMLPLFQAMFRGLAPVIGAATNRVSLVHAEDLAAALLAWLERGRAHALYEVGDGRANGYSWQEIIDIAQGLRGRRILRLPVPVPLVRLVARLNLTLARLTDRAPMLSPGKVRELTHPDWVADNTSLHTDTGWTPQIDLAEGLRRTLNLVA
jgi:nucleoside-diphosphate-sugar epimerase